MRTRSDPPAAGVARHEMALGLTSMFRALPDGARRREVVLEQQFKGCIVRVIGMELSAFEQSVFFSILDLAGAGGDAVRQVPTSQTDLIPAAPPRGMRTGENIAASADSLEIRTTLSDILRCCGHPDPRLAGSETRRSVQVALQRLGGVTVAVTQSGGKGGFVSLLRAGWSADGITVLLNPRSAAALLALRGYAAVNMRSYRALTTPTARVMYGWLCAWFAGTSRPRSISLDKMEVHVFGEVAKNRATRCKRRSLLRDAATQIAARSDMLCCEAGKDVLRVERSRAVNILQPSGKRSPSENGPVKVFPAISRKYTESQGSGGLRPPSLGERPAAPEREKREKTRCTHPPQGGREHTSADGVTFRQAVNVLEGAQNDQL